MLDPTCSYYFMLRETSGYLVADSQWLIFFFSSCCPVGEVTSWCSVRLLPSPAEVQAIEAFDTIFNNDTVSNSAQVGVDRLASWRWKNICRIFRAAGLDTFFSYDRILSDRRFWCCVQLRWALVGVVPHDSTLIAGNVGFSTNSESSRLQSHVVASCGGCWMSTCLTIHISCLLLSLTSSRLFASLDNLSS
jgi:hypothetical protein